ncbi:transporter substrate-binding domain-containing protein [Rhizobiaceae bacterium BDR2-2]|uniref:Transporter substrate-binding domain-containing protein n=1 Tax=Ectorhizobium quercum TaxID=2965071 RepID=A0AAE3MUR7_9HYPH|nr:transporter substrate-binding domain-containing protein [Ectorhizobium quercum]MCX8995523.1 transporter substrate-binding domain-containing protein [Ectorhizobium quercum]
MMNRRDFAGLIGLAGTGAAVAALATPAVAQSSVNESTFDKIRRTKKLRIAGIPGTEPYYHKDLISGEWSGFCISMAKDLAASLEAEIEVSETTWANAVLDLQADKIDIMFGLSPTPTRALIVEFTRPIMNNTFTLVARSGIEGETWEDFNKPEFRVAVDIGSTQDTFARSALPKSTLNALPTFNDVTAALVSGRADLSVQVAMNSLATVKKNPSVGTIIVPTPISAQPTCAGVRADPDGRFLRFVDNWLEYNRSLGAMKTWIVSSLSLANIKPEDIPASLTF